MDRRQCKAARGLLNWSQDDLARESGLSSNVITSFESGIRNPTEKSLAAVRGALVVSGVMFIDESDGMGVKLRRNPIEVGRQLPAAHGQINRWQARAARAVLGLSQPEAAETVGVGLSLLVAFETGSRDPHRNNRQKIQAGYEQRGIRFFEDGDRSAISFVPRPAADEVPIDIAS